MLAEFCIQSRVFRVQSYGMKCLNIKMSDEFMNITKIEDAVACALASCFAQIAHVGGCCFCCSGAQARSDLRQRVSSQRRCMSNSLSMCVLSVWKPEEDEEFEDRDGNVYSKKVYDDLQRQGLL